MARDCKEMTCFSWLYSKSKINKVTLGSASVPWLAISLSSVKIEQNQIKVEVGGSW